MGSQVRAAKRLRVQQPTISRHVQRVQDHFGGGLFEAGASGKLSTRGAIVARAERVAIAELSRTCERLATDRPVLRIGFIRPVRPLIDRALRALTRLNGNAAFDVRLLELTAEAQASALVRRELDIAVSYAIPAFATAHGVEESVVTQQQPFALVIPERAWVRGKPSTAALAQLVYADSSTLV